MEDQGQLPRLARLSAYYELAKKLLCGESSCAAPDLGLEVSCNPEPLGPTQRVASATSHQEGCEFGGDDDEFNDPILERRGKSLLVVNLSRETARNIAAWCDGDMDGARCAKNIIDTTSSAVGGYVGICSGAAAGSMFGIVGMALGGVVGGWFGQCTAGEMAHELTQALFALPRTVAVQRAYEFLSVSAYASDQEVNQAYRRLALQLHPDKPMGSHNAFIKLQCCMEIVRLDRTRPWR